jgi:NAD(P)-dependent dehydrogenase (short-subunit alcohol dehydrogenase family)
MLENRTILIAGASGAIGQAVARECALKGAKLFLGYNKSPEVVDKLIAEFKDAKKIKLDLSSIDSLSEGFEEHKSELTELYGMVNCTGINISGPLISLDNDAITQQLTINLTGAIQLTQLAVKLMVRKKRGSIVHLGSVSAHRMLRGHSVYSATKSGLEGFVKAMAAETAKRKVRINCVLPGPVMSEMLKKSIDQTGDEPHKRVPMQRMVEASEVAKTVSFLLSDDSSAITGSMVPVDCGYLLW